jgi:hypothetical protein
LSEIGYFFYAGGSFLFSLFFRKQSYIVYDGEELRIFGLVKYNILLNDWETKLISLMKSSFSSNDLIDELKRD